MAIQQFVILKDKEIKKQAHRVDKASRETVDLDGLAQKIFGKYLKFLQGKVLERTSARPAGPEVMNKPKPATIDPSTEDFGANQSVHMSEFPIESSAQVQGANKLIQKA